MRAQQLGRDAAAVVAHAQHALAALRARPRAAAAARRPAASSSACSAFISRLWTICSSATGSACTLTGACGAPSKHRRDRALVELRRQQVQGAAHRLLQRHRPGGAGLAGTLDHAAQAAHHVGRTARLLGRLLHRAARGRELGRVLVEQPARRLRVGQHRRQRLVELVRHAGRELAQRVEPRDLAQPQQLLGAPALDALALQRAGAATAPRPWRRPMPAIQAQGSSPQDTWRSATRSKGWLSEASALRKAKGQPCARRRHARAAPRTAGPRARAPRAPGWSSGPSASRAKARCRRGRCRAHSWPASAPITSR